MDAEQEYMILMKLKQNNVWYKLKCQRYSGNDQYHNVFDIGYNENNTFGEIEFSKIPTWRVFWYDNGIVHRDSGYLLTNFEKLIRRIMKNCLPGIKKKMMDERKAEIEKDFI